MAALMIVPESASVTNEFRALGVPKSLLEGLALKVLYVEGECSVLDLGERMRLSLSVMDHLFQRLRHDQLCEVTGMVGGIHRVTTTSQGKDRALELLSQSQYTGAAPVSIRDYVAQVRAQSVRSYAASRADLERAFAKLVLSPATLDQLGTAVVSGRSIFLHGPAGTGKTLIAETLVDVYEDLVWVPYAVEVDGQIITIYDPHVHQLYTGPTTEDRDARWVACRRPRVVAGGELTLEMLDLQFNAATKFYTAPLQMKANNGILIVDDFGRQRMRPEDLLNRWIVPLDRGIDFLTLAGGKKFEVPFDVMVAFATNLDPSSLGDDAFLRRIQTKVWVGPTNREQFHEIFRRFCEGAGLACDASAVDFVIEVLRGLQEPLKACYPGDLVRQIVWSARYQGIEPELSRANLLQACRNYFVQAAPGGDGKAEEQ